MHTHVSTTANALCTCDTTQEVHECLAVSHNTPPSPNRRTQHWPIVSVEAYRLVVVQAENIQKMPERLCLRPQRFRRTERKR